MTYARASNAYRSVDLQSAPKHEIVRRLFERFTQDCAQARTAITAKDVAGKGAAIDHALRIVGELEASLDHTATPEISKNLQGLYQFVTQRLLTANLESDVKTLDEASTIMTEIGATFRQAFELR